MGVCTSKLPNKYSTASKSVGSEDRLDYLVDVNWKLITSELTRYDTDSASDPLTTFRVINEELLKLTKHNSVTYSLYSSDQFLIDVICMTCFTIREQELLVRLYIDVVIKGDTSLHKVVNLDDLYLSCLDANSAKPSILILEEYLKNPKRNRKQDNMTDLGQSVLGVAMHRFQAFLGGFKYGNFLTLIKI